MWLLMADAWHFSNQNIYYVGHEGPGKMMDYFFTTYTFFVPFSDKQTQRERETYVQILGVLGMDGSLLNLFFFFFFWDYKCIS